MFCGLYVVQCEANVVVALLKKSHRRYGNSLIHPSVLDTQDPLLRSFADLKDVLNSVSDLAEINPISYLSPFLDVIKSEHTNGPVTSQAIISVEKFVNYGLIDDNSIKASIAVESITQAITRAKFMGGSDNGSDECVLLKIVQALRSLIMSKYGRLLSDESVCEMIQSCFKMAFELTFSELLRKVCESTLMDMTQVIFNRLPSFEEDVRNLYPHMLHARIKKKKKLGEKNFGHKEFLNNIPKKVEETDFLEAEEGKIVDENDKLLGDEGTKQNLCEDIDDGNVPDAENDDSSGGSSDAEIEKHNHEVLNEKVAAIKDHKKIVYSSDSEMSDTPQVIDIMDQDVNGEPVNKKSASKQHTPYGLPCAAELLRFLATISNPLNKDNTENMILLSLNLLTVALEAGADYFANYSRLLPLVQNELCRSLLQNLESEKLPILAVTNRVCFLLFEALRTHLKLQMEMYFQKLRNIVLAEQKVTYEQKEIALESIVHMWKIPGLVTELYLNYDCDSYCSNLFEELTKLLLENAFPVNGLLSTNILSLDALLAVVETIDGNCLQRQANNAESSNLPLSYTQIRPNRMSSSENIPSLSQVIHQKKQKKIITEGTELFNQSPKSGIQYLIEKGVLSSSMNPTEIAHWIRSNPRLDKRKIAEYICSRERKEILKAFVGSFNFTNTRIDDALRQFLEAFRLPGEAAEISMVIELFSEFWHLANNEPFNHVDAAFTLSYAIIMLNTDQHNPVVGKNQQRMTVECFKRNLSGTNHGEDFDGQMLENIYHTIKHNEIVMPAEQTGAVKLDYEWKLLLKRMNSNEGKFLHAPVGWNDQDLFSIIWGPATASLSFIFDKSEQESITAKSLNGYRKCASIAAHYGMSDVFDNLIIHLCKFSTLLSPSTDSSDENTSGSGRTTTIKGSVVPETPENVTVAFAENMKAQLATKTMFQLVHIHGDILREGWRNVLECIVYLFKFEMLPKVLTEVEDFVSPTKVISIQRKKENKDKKNADHSLLSWFGLGSSNYDSSYGGRTSKEYKELVEAGKQIIVDCHPEQLITDGKYLRTSALVELLNNIIAISISIYDDDYYEGDEKKVVKLNYKDEDSMILLLEIMISVTLENKDRLTSIWHLVKRHIEWLLNTFGKNTFIVERAIVGLLRIANRNLYRLKDDIANEVLQSFNILLYLRPTAFFLFSKQISFGLHDLLRLNAANVHKRQHWEVIFSLMEATGAANYPKESIKSDPIINHTTREVVSDTENTNIIKDMSIDRGYTSDKGLTEIDGKCSLFQADSQLSIGSNSDWVKIKDKKFDRETIVLVSGLAKHDSLAFLKVGEILSFLVRDFVHITPENFDSCVKCIRSMTEAGMDGGFNAVGTIALDGGKKFGNPDDKYASSESINSTGSDKQQQSQLSEAYYYTTLQLLELSYSLHIKAYSFFKAWSESDKAIDSSIPHLWKSCWCPLLQVIARVCCDCRRQVRTQAINTLVRAFLIQELGSLTSTEWESCFNDILFPLLTKLLENIFPMDPIGMEETRVRAIQLVCKVLLNHLNSLQSLPSFINLWIKLLDSMKSYLLTERCEMLAEAVPESLKNMILVLDSIGTFEANIQFYEMTRKKLDEFLPELVKEVMNREIDRSISLPQYNV
ncbi:Golgi-specific brefeldin A-resistance guanine nucleotide exchange factor 1 [Strongyloides ratti]|uniref:Golgi-specific brefeldin A-resistance guanine nucleotide exchange factor 1 n=1 Tax=Strongyloides ratti TaxID=34506 RepID=A0A090LA89_STRRB|nr:Golgi-specific brefeldin A-resistance guanine nucleotide exchange factor 1 [Strongyloides ratti]CEF66676.1 Golgi-specific brefeldin A-resistance guanine nucleotide exchange factor 1 [Strongyloides ratti]